MYKDKDLKIPNPLTDDEQNEPLFTDKPRKPSKIFTDNGSLLEDTELRKAFPNETEQILNVFYTELTDIGNTDATGANTIIQWAAEIQDKYGSDVLAMAISAAKGQGYYITPGVLYRESEATFYTQRLEEFLPTGQDYAERDDAEQGYEEDIEYEDRNSG